MVKLTEDLILMQSSESVNLSMVSSVPSTPRQQSQDESSSLDDVTPDPDSSQIPLSTVGYRKINCWLVPLMHAKTDKVTRITFTILLRSTFEGLSSCLFITRFVTKKSFHILFIMKCS